METTIGNRLRILRKYRGLTQEQLAEQIYSKGSTISDYENDKNDICASTICRLAKALHVKPGYFFGDEPLEHYIDVNADNQMERDVKEIENLFRRISRDEVRSIVIMNTKNMLIL